MPAPRRRSRLAVLLLLCRAAVPCIPRPGAILPRQCPCLTGSGSWAIVNFSAAELYYGRPTPEVHDDQSRTRQLPAAPGVFADASQRRCHPSDRRGSAPGRRRGERQPVQHAESTWPTLAPTISSRSLPSVCWKNEEKGLEEITAALQRIEIGSFGLCEECKKPIPKTRLQALPYARYCVECARKLQQST